MNQSNSESLGEPSKNNGSNTLPDSSCRDWLKQSLLEHGINTIIYYPIPIHLQPAYEGLSQGPGSLPVTEQLCSQVLSLPIFPELSEDQQQQVVSMLHKLLSPATTTHMSKVA